MTRKAFLALCGSVLAAPFVARHVVTAPAPIVPKPPDMPKFTFKGTEMVFDQVYPGDTVFLIPRGQEDLYRRVLGGDRLYGIGSWDTHRGDSH
jgi:hypothetical protein